VKPGRGFKRRFRSRLRAPREQPGAEGNRRASAASDLGEAWQRVGTGNERRGTRGGKINLSLQNLNQEQEGGGGINVGTLKQLTDMKHSLGNLAIGGPADPWLHPGASHHGKRKNVARERGSKESIPRSFKNHRERKTGR